MLSKNTFNPNKMRAAFLNLGCKVNAYETEAMIELCKNAGFAIVDFQEIADVYVVNTCTVTNIADRKSRQMLHKAKHRNPDACVVAVGCYAQESKEVLENDDTVDIIIGNNHKNDLIDRLRLYFEENESTIVEDITDQTEYEELHIGAVSEKTRAYIKIQDGCSQFCSYCIIPYTRGRIRSREEEEVVKEVKGLVGLGYKEIVLTGIHLSSYGLNKAGDNLDGRPLVHLTQRLNKIEGLERIRFGSLEPRIINKDFTRQLAECKKVCPHFHLSMQSGCDETLLRMNRKYTSGQYEEACMILREFFDNPAITTDVIVGFPGETEDEFAATCAFVKKIGFAQMHVFKFSKRKGTKAEGLPDQISDQIKQERSERLIEIEKELKHHYQKSFLGTKTTILAEETCMIEGKRYVAGYNERYVRFLCETAKEASNTMLRGRTVDFLMDGLLLEECKDGEI